MSDIAKRRVYCGWVPTVLGKLSFTKIYSGFGVTRGAHSRDGEGFVVAVYGSRVIMSDHMFPRVQSVLFRETGVFQFGLVAIGEGGWDSVGEIEGRVYMDPISGLFLASNQRAFRNELHKAVSDIESPNHSAVLDEYKHWTEGINGKARMAAGFELKRDGQVTIRFGPEDVQGISSAQIDPDGLIDDRASLLIGKGFYNVIRMVVHAHKHHHSCVDNIVTIHEHDDAKDWKAQVQYSMVRRILDKHGDASEFGQLEAMGVAAYLDTFDEVVFSTVDRKDLLPDKSLRIPKVGNFRKSVQASLGLRSVKRAKKETTALFFIGLIGVGIAAMQLLDLKKGMETFLWFGVALLIFLLAWIGIWHRDEYWFYMEGLNTIRLFHIARIVAWILTALFVTGLYYVGLGTRF